MHRAPYTQYRSLRGLFYRPWQSLVILFAFLANMLGPVPLAQAQDYRLPAPGTMVSLSPAFTPPMLKGLKVHPDNPFRFDFILDKGNSELGNDQLKDESSKLIKYFLASLTIPEKDLWVNLSPYEKDRIIPNSFGLTEMGRDLLAEDYMLKQITASLIYPEGKIGKKFWKRIYEEAAKKFGTTNIPVNTFNKVWIVPEKAVVYENAKAGTAYVVESKLKVMLDQDYLALEKNTKTLSFPNASVGNPDMTGPPTKTFGGDNMNSLGSQIVREIVIPELAKEVNSGQNFSQLRQVYNSLILATWYKKKIKDSVLSQVYADKNKVSGILSSPNASVGDPEQIYQRYLQAFKKGTYNYIKEEIDPLTQQSIPRKYFSGGTDLAMNANTFELVSDPAQLPTPKNTEALVQMRADAAMQNTVNVNLGIQTEDIKDDLIKQLREILSDDTVSFDAPNRQIFPVTVKLREERQWGEKIDAEQLIFPLLERLMKGEDQIADYNIEPFFKEIFKYMDKHPGDEGKFETFFTRFLRVHFDDKSLPRLYVMHRLIWEYSPQLGIAILHTTINHILGYVKARRTGPILPTDTNHYAHILLDILYLTKQTEIAQQVLKGGQIAEEIKKYTEIHFVSANDTAALYSLFSSDFKTRRDFDTWIESPDAFISEIGPAVKNPAWRLLRFIQRRLENAVSGYEKVFEDIIQEIEGFIIKEEKIESNSKLKVGDIIKVQFKGDKKPVFAVVADENKEGYFLLSFNLVDLWYLNVTHKYLVNRPKVTGERNVAITRLILEPNFTTLAGEVTHTIDQNAAMRAVGRKSILEENKMWADTGVEKESTKASPVINNRNGGIDLTSDKALSVQSNGQGIKFHIDPAQLQQLQNAPGFVPVIINIEPLNDLRSFLEANVLDSR